MLGIQCADKENSACPSFLLYPWCPGNYLKFLTTLLVNSQRRDKTTKQNGAYHRLHYISLVIYCQPSLIILNYGGFRQADQLSNRPFQL